MLEVHMSADEVRPVGPADAAGQAGPERETGRDRPVSMPVLLVRRPLRKVAVGTGLAAYSWVAGSAAAFSAESLLSVLLPGAVMGFIAYGRPPQRIPPPESIDVAGFSYWVIVIAALFEWEAAAFRSGAKWWHPSLTALVNPIIQPHPVKSAAIMLWLLSGWALVKR
jgi:hypothetical protein